MRAAQPAAIALTATSQAPEAGVLEEVRLALGHLTCCVPSRKKDAPAPCTALSPPPAPPRCRAPPQTCSPRRAKSLEISTAARDR